MIVGFDDIRKIFMLADFHLNADGAPRYGVYEVTYQELEDAVRKLPQELNILGCIELWHYCPDVPCIFDTETVIQSISDYLESTYTPHRNTNWLSTSVMEYGFKIYDFLLSKLEKSGTEDNKGDLQFFHTGNFRFFHVLADHKQLMFLRLQYMHELGLIREAEVLSYEKLLQETELLRNLLLKFGVSRKTSLLDRSILQLRSIAETEQRILRDVLNESSSLQYK